MRCVFNIICNLKLNGCPQLRVVSFLSCHNLIVASSSAWSSCSVQLVVRWIARSTEVLWTSQRCILPVPLVWLSVAACQVVLCRANLPPWLLRLNHLLAFLHRPYTLQLSTSPYCSPLAPPCGCFVSYSECVRVCVCVCVRTWECVCVCVCLCKWVFQVAAVWM